MGVFAQVPERTLNSAMQRYGRGTLVASEPTPHGIENSNFFVTTEDSQSRRTEWVLTFMEHPPSRTGLETLARLARAGLPVPAPVATTGGDVAPRVDGHPTLLAPRLRGSHPQYPDAPCCAAAGRFLGRMHRITAGLPGPEHPRNLLWLERGWREHTRRLGHAQSDLMRRALDGVVSASGRRDWQQLPMGIVHGDLFRDNALMEGSTLTGVIDFHHAARAPLLFDLAVVANDWCMARDRSPDASGPSGACAPTSGQADDPLAAAKLDQPLVDALVGAYCAQRRLTDDELWLWPLMLSLAALRFWVARLDSPRKPPEEMARHLAGYLRHPPRLDRERLARAAAVAATG